MKDKRSIAICLLLLTVLINCVFVYTTLAPSPSQPFWIRGGVYPSAYTFTLWRDGSNYFAKNRFGEISYSGSNLSGVTQDCLDYIETNHGGSLYFEPTGGVYTFGYSMFIPSNCLIDFGWSRLRMANNFAFANISGSDIQMFSNKGFPYSQVANVTIQNALIDGNHDGQTECGGIIAIKRGVKICVRNLRIEHAAYDGHDAIIFAVTNASLIENVIAYDAGVIDGAWIGLRGCRNIQIRNCYLENSVADLIAVYKETEHVYGVDRYCWDVSVSGCTLVGAGRNAIRVEEGNYEIRIADNTIYDAGRDPTSVYLQNIDHAAILLYGLSDFHVQDNVIRRIAHNQTFGIYVYGYEETLNRTLISGNVIQNNYIGSIYLRNCTQTTITDNYLESLNFGVNVTCLQVHHNFGYVTEIAGSASASFQDWIAFGVTFPTAPQSVVISVMTDDSRYIAQPYSVNTTHFRLLLWDDVATAYETVDKPIAFAAVYDPTP